MLEGIGSGEVLLTSAFIAYESAFSYSQFLPSVMTIRAFVDTPEKLAAIRQGEVIGTLFTGGFAVLFSLIMRSLMPLLMAGIAVAFTLIAYEWAVRQAPAWNG